MRHARKRDAIVCAWLRSLRSDTSPGDRGRHRAVLFTRRHLDQILGRQRDQESAGGWRTVRHNLQRAGRGQLGCELGRGRHHLLRWPSGHLQSVFGRWNSCRGDYAGRCHARTAFAAIHAPRWTGNPVHDRDLQDWDTANVVLLSLDSGERRVLIPGGADARYVNTGHIVFMKTGTLMAVPFDVRSRQITGTAVTLVEGVMQGVNAPNSLFETGAGQFAVASGSLIYALGGISPSLESSWVWFDRTGTAEGIEAVPAGPYLFARLSPNGERVAVNVRRMASRIADVWVYDVVRGVPTRLTFEGSNSWPVWSPDGKRLVYGSSDGRYFQPLSDQRGWQRQTRAARDQRLRADSIVMGTTTNMIAFLQRPQIGSYGIWVLPMEGERKPRLFLESRFSLAHPEFSPDGRWIAYVSNESGNREVYVQPYPGPGEKIRISTDGGTEPIWNANGRELLYRPRTHQIFSTPIRSLSPFLAGAPRLLFELKAGEYRFDGARPKLECHRRRPAIPLVAIHCINGQAGLRDARRAELGRRAEAPRPGEVAVGHTGRCVVERPASRG